MIHQDTSVSYLASAKEFPGILKTLIRDLQETQDSTAHHLLPLTHQTLTSLTARKPHECGYLLFILPSHVKI